MKRPLVLAIVAVAVIVLHAILVRHAAHSAVAHVLLGSGNGRPPVGAALVAIALVVARLGAILVAPGLLFAAAAELVAHVQSRHGSRSGAGISDAVADGTGTSIGIGRTE